MTEIFISGRNIVRQLLHRPNLIFDIYWVQYTSITGTCWNIWSCLMLLIILPRLSYHVVNGCTKPSSADVSPWTNRLFFTQKGYPFDHTESAPRFWYTSSGYWAFSTQTVSVPDRFPFFPCVGDRPVLLLLLVVIGPFLHKP